MCLFAFLLFIPLMIKLISFLTRFGEENRYICINMDRAESYDEYRYWRRELRCHYLYLIPFVNKRNIKYVYNFFFKRNKEQEERKDAIMSLIAPSILSICCCLVCLCGMTFAWFSASKTSGTIPLQAATYSISAEVKEGSTVINSNPDGSYPLVHNKQYTITLTANGTAIYGGFCVVNFAGTDVYTSDLILIGNTLTLYFSPTVDGNINFTGNWGTCTNPIDIQDFGKISTTPPPATETTTVTIGGDSVTLPPAGKDSTETGTPSVTDELVTGTATTLVEATSVTTPPESTHTTTPDETQAASTETAAETLSETTLTTNADMAPETTSASVPH